MNIKNILIFILFLTLSACASEPPAPPPPNGSDVALAEASYSVSRSIVDLSATAQASHPPPVLESPPSPSSYHMSQVVSVDWSGPVEPLIKQLADASNYRLRVLGAQPGIPVMVSVYSKNQMLADVLRDVGFQCGRRANVVIFPDSRVIELRYAKN